MKDMVGRLFEVGQYVAKAYGNGDLRILRVVKITEEGVYLGKGNHPLLFPESVLIVQDIKNMDKGRHEPFV